ncbi:MAG TPA: hypothetical protein VGI48_19795, partial [Caldimonas sp.]
MAVIRAPAAASGIDTVEPVIVTLPASVPWMLAPAAGAPPLVVMVLAALVEIDPEALSTTL